MKEKIENLNYSMSIIAIKTIIEDLLTKQILSSSHFSS